MTQQNEIFHLSEFYKYCLNVCPEFRENNENWHYFHGWCRCSIDPYLIDGKITVQNDVLVNQILYSLTDYCEYCACFE